MRTLFGILGFFIVLIICMKMGTPAGIFIDLPSLMIVLGTTLTLTFSRHTIDEIKQSSGDVIHSMINFSLMGGGIGFIVGLIQSFQKISDPANIGPSIALSMISLLYSLILASVLYAYKKKITSRRIGVAGIVGGVAALIPVILGLVSLSA